MIGNTMREMKYLIFYVLLFNGVKKMFYNSTMNLKICIVVSKEGIVPV